MVYSTFYGGFVIVGGTSLAAPIVASEILLANQVRRSHGKGPLSTVINSPNNLQKILYKTIYTNPSLYAAVFYDIIQGSVGRYRCVPGFDGDGLGRLKVIPFVNAVS